MNGRDATELYLGEVYAQDVPRPARQLGWAQALDKAQQRFNRALAGSRAARCALLAGHAETAPAQAAGHMLARIELSAVPDGTAPAPDQCLRAGLLAVRDLEAAAGDRHAVLEALRPLRLRAEFMAALIERVAGQPGADGRGFVRAGTPILSRIGVLTAQLVRANQRLVAALARQYRNGPLAFMDLVQEGNLGLLRAIERFDPGQGTRVSTYAMWWIRRAMVYAIARQGRDVRPSVAQYWGARQLMREMERLEQAAGRVPSLREAARQLGIGVHQLQQGLAVLAPPLPLDAPMGRGGQGDGPAHTDRLPGATEDGPEPRALHADLRQAVKELLLRLPERHANILRMRFGIGLRDDCTLDQIARQQGVTRERIRQLEAQALEALRRLEPAWVLRDCLS